MLLRDGFFHSPLCLRDSSRLMRGGLQAFHRMGSAGGRLSSWQFRDLVNIALHREDKGPMSQSLSRAPSTRVGSGRSPLPLFSCTTPHCWNPSNNPGRLWLSSTFLRSPLRLNIFLCCWLVGLTQNSDSRLQTSFLLRFLKNHVGGLLAI